MALDYSAGFLSGSSLLKAPAADGTSGQVLQTDGSGQLSFATISATAGGVSGDIQFNDGGSFGGFGDWDGTVLSFDGTLRVRRAFEQMRCEYDGANYWGFKVASDGALTLTGFGTDPDFAVDASGGSISFDNGTTSLSLFANQIQTGAEFRTLHNATSGGKVELGSLSGSNMTPGVFAVSESSAYGFRYITQNDSGNSYSSAGISFEVRAAGVSTGLTSGVVFSFDNGFGNPLMQVLATGSVNAANGVGYFGVTPPASKPATPATLADIISIGQSYGWWV